MGLDVNGTRFLLYARQRGVAFTTSAMIGRQQMLIGAKSLHRNYLQFGFDLELKTVEGLLTRSGGYAEPFLTLLGADEIVSFDASDYEGATYRHDFNQPIPDEFKNKFSVVLDGGSLEHIFNFPRAIKNCMEMVSEGGHFLAITPANNHCGHGFYQFSPELYFRIFSPANGFEIEQIAVYEETFDPPWYEVIDPVAVKERVMLINGEPSMLLIIAKKLKTVEIFAKPPQQSDYFTRWNASGEINSAVMNTSSSRSVLKRIARLPFSAIHRARVLVDRSRGMLNRDHKHYRKIDLDGLE
jgi:SAM-dependent methyltransferase